MSAINKLKSKLTATRKDAWSAFKGGLKIKGYEYYQPPAAVKYRYPAPGSCALDETDKFNLYKADWKMPFRTSQFNIQKIEHTYHDDDPREAMTYVSHDTGLDANRARHGLYDQAILDEATPVLKENAKIGIHDGDVHSEELRSELWAGFERQE